MKRKTANDELLARVEEQLRRPTRCRIKLMSVEMEGGWRENPLYKGEPVHVEHDGSVFNPTRVVGAQVKPPGITLIGEVSCKPPLLPIGVPAWMRAHFPHKVDGTCGLHVHMSFKDIRHYCLLMDNTLLRDAIVKFVGVWGQQEGLAKDNPLWERLKGKYEYCTDKFWPDLQANAARDHDRQRDGNRYTMINYGWTVHETVECRLLPMFDSVERCIRAVNLVKNITNAVLAVNDHREQKFVAEVSVKDAQPEQRGWRVRV